MFHYLSGLILLCLTASVLPVRNDQGRFYRSSVQDDDPKPMIAGGTQATPGEFPWLVSIQVTNFQDGWHLCGGVLISEEWALTAAHCLDSERPEELWVVSGEYDKSVEEGTEQRLLVDSFIQHPEYIYYKTPYVNDIALIHLSTPAVLDPYTQVAQLPSSSSSTFQDKCYECGWGIPAENLPGTQLVNVADVYRLDSEMCSSIYGALELGSTCAGNLAGTGFCVGDNGGPLHCNETETNQVVVSAIMSWREGCAVENKPGVYVDLPYYLSWIDSITKSKS